MTVEEQNRGKVLEVLRWVSGRTRDQPGNLEVFVGVQTGTSSSRARMDAEWSSQAALDRYLRCDVFGVLLSVTELSDSHPAIWQEKLVGRRGFDQLIEIRNAAAGRGDHAGVRRGPRVGDEP